MGYTAEARGDVLSVERVFDLSKRASFGLWHKQHYESCTQHAERGEEQEHAGASERCKNVVEEGGDEVTRAPVCERGEGTSRRPNIGYEKKDTHAQG